MIPTPEQLAEIAEQDAGNLAEIPFAALLCAQAVAARTVEIEIVRKPLNKTIVFEGGVPIDCRSNLLHETFGRFLVDRGSIDQATAQELRAEAARTGMQIGEILIRDQRMGASEVFRALQANLAKKLLDGFTWRQGTFRAREPSGKTTSPLKVKVPQLVVTGIVKLARQEEIDRAVASLVGKRLVLHPRPPYALGDIRLTGDQRTLARSLFSGKSLDELAAEARLPFPEMIRLLYALGMLGIVVSQEQLAAADADTVTGPDTKPMNRSSEILPRPTTRDELDAVREEVHAAYLRYRTQDAFDLLGLEDGASNLDMENAFLAFSQTFAPWRFQDSISDLHEKAEALFLAGGRAFGELTNVDLRHALLARRKQLREDKRKDPAADRFAIRSDLLDPRVQFDKGVALLESGRFDEAVELLAFAHDLDPQNTRYKSELAYCLYRADPRNASEALAELDETVRIDPKFGLARYYRGVLLGEGGDLEGAETELRRAIKLMSPDRRPIEALKNLAAKKG